jgi:folate-binding protein YgfZ
MSTADPAPAAASSHGLQEVPALPLAALHRRLGARLAPLPAGGASGVHPAGPPLVPMRYGSLQAEYEALRQGCGLADRSWIGRLEMLGADRLRFLNAYVTCEVKGLAPGQGGYGFLTSSQGRILSDLALLAQTDRLWLELPPGLEQTFVEHLARYLIADRVEMRPLAEVLPITLAGPRAASTLAGLVPGIELPQAPWGHVAAVVSGAEVVVQRSERLGVPAFTLWVAAALAEPLWELLRSQDGVRPVGYEALEIVRTEMGIPRFGHDFGPLNFPQETGAEEAVSYTKGCYLGQEVVARIHYRGGVQKTLRGLLFDADPALPPPAPGTALLYEGREAGTLGTAVRSLALNRQIGLAILHRRAAAPGSRLGLGISAGAAGSLASASSGGEAEVRTLPLIALDEPAPHRDQIIE